MRDGGGAEAGIGESRGLYLSLADLDVTKVDVLGIQRGTD